MRTRMFTANADGSDLHVVDDYGGMSHFIWRDPETILAWSWQPSHEGAFYVYRDRTDRVEVIGTHAMTLNGHCTYLSDPDWILNDTYPREGTRTQELYLYHVPTGTRVELGGFHAPEAYRDESRRAATCTRAPTRAAAWSPSTPPTPAAASSTCSTSPPRSPPSSPPSSRPRPMRAFWRRGQSVNPKYSVWINSSRIDHGLPEKLFRIPSCYSTGT